MNALGSEKVAVVAVIDPDVTAASSVNSAWVSAKDFHRFMAIICAGTLGASATVDALIQQATDASGTGAKAVTGKAITQLTQAGSDSDRQAVINLATEELDVDNGFDYIRLQVTVGTATSDIGALLLGVAPRNAPASDHDVSTVVEIIA